MYCEDEILSILEHCVAVNSLSAFYPPHRIAELAKQLQPIGPRVFELGVKWQLPAETVKSLYQLALYDVVVLADDSGSMRHDENGVRIAQLKNNLAFIAETCTLFDTDGISIRFLNYPQSGNNIRDMRSVEQVLDHCPFRGNTRLGTQLEIRILEPLLYSKICKKGFLRTKIDLSKLEKPLLVLMITDGEPTGEARGKLGETLRHARKIMDDCGTGLVAFGISQVGDDAKATQFLHELDSDKEVGYFVDVSSAFAVEAAQMLAKGIVLTGEMWLAKMVLGAIDRGYDSLDE